MLKSFWQCQKSVVDALKTAWDWPIKKNAEATGDFIGNNIADTVETLHTDISSVSWVIQGH